jgi:polyhydroxyalkanoate synthesis repressor PhaR
LTHRQKDTRFNTPLAFRLRLRDSAVRNAALGSDMADTTEAGGDKAKVVIKKYANRRLYNTASSSYVTLDHLSEMVKEGVDFVVYDAKTGEDITRPVLAQIIFDEESRGSSLLPIQFLRQLISFYGDSMQSFLPSYLEMSLDSFTKQQERFAGQFAAGPLSGAMGGATPSLGAYEEQVRQNMALFDRAMKMFTPFNLPAAPAASPAKPEPTAEVPTAPAEPDELSALKAQMEAMRREIDRLASKS